MEIERGGSGRFVTSEASEDGDQSVAHGAWSFERAALPAIGEEAPFAREQRIDATCQANAQPAHPLNQIVTALGLDDQVNVIGLSRELADSKALGRALCGVRNRFAHRRKQGLGAQRTARGAQRYVDGVLRAVFGPSSMQNLSRLWTGGTPSARAATAPIRALGRRGLSLPRALLARVGFGSSAGSCQFECTWSGEHGTR